MENKNIQLTFANILAFMRIIAFCTIRNFISKHPEASASLIEWHIKAKEGAWANINDIKKTYNSVDYVGNKRYVFNIGGNNFRIVAMIFFEVQQIYIRFIGTHNEYDKIDSKNI